MWTFLEMYLTTNDPLTVLKNNKENSKVDVRFGRNIRKLDFVQKSPLNVIFSLSCSQSETAFRRVWPSRLDLSRLSFFTWKPTWRGLSGIYLPKQNTMTVAAAAAAATVVVLPLRSELISDPRCKRWRGASERVGLGTRRRRRARHTTINFGGTRATLRAPQDNRLPFGASEPLNFSRIKSQHDWHTAPGGLSDWAARDYLPVTRTVLSLMNSTHTCSAAQPKVGRHFQTVVVSRPSVRSTRNDRTRVVV